MVLISYRYRKRHSLCLAKMAFKYSFGAMGDGRSSPATRRAFRNQSNDAGLARGLTSASRNGG